MVRNNTLLLLLLISLPAWTRDPFLPTDALSCAVQDEAPVAWQLQGIIGRLGHYQAWLVASDRPRQRVKLNETLADTTWRVTQIDRRSITLTDTRHCQPAVTLRIKGSKYVKDNHPHSVTDKPVQPRG